MYIHFARKFLEGVARSGEEERVRYWEYGRQGWTFHGKGVWLYQGKEEWPSATLVGSSNYGEFKIIVQTSKLIKDTFGLAIFDMSYRCWVSQKFRNCLSCLAKVIGH